MSHLNMGLIDPASLPAVAPGRRFVFFNSAGALCYKNDAGQIQLASEQGQQGNAGPIGPQGAIGPQGPQGFQGLQGMQGETGLIGQTGNDGNAGPQGLTGETGATGQNGADGATGQAGPVGPEPLRAFSPSTALVDGVNTVANVVMGSMLIGSDATNFDSFKLEAFGVFDGATGAGNVIPFIQVGATKVAASIVQSAGTTANQQFIMRWSCQWVNGSIRAVCEWKATRNNAYAALLSAVVTIPMAVGSTLSFGVNMSNAIATFAVKPRAAWVRREY